MNFGRGNYTNNLEDDIGDEIFNNIDSFQVTILLKDVNDRTPVFQFQDYQSEVSEDSPVGSTVTTVQATDKDSADNTVVITLSTFFSINHLYISAVVLIERNSAWTVKTVAHCYSCELLCLDFSFAFSRRMQDLRTAIHKDYTGCYLTTLKLMGSITVEALVRGHPREAEKVSATVAGRLRECVNTEFV